MPDLHGKKLSMVERLGSTVYFASYTSLHSFLVRLILVNACRKRIPVFRSLRALRMPESLL